ncbi:MULTISPECIES: TnpV protein [unclassified Clostridium]|uniref:TnpV protein n=1 Tax=Clostridium sp. Maddingley MBC34-26 TaxID=1196322 RepID=UPI0009FBF631
MKENLNLSYKEIDGIFYPEIQISRNKEVDQKPLGKYGQMALNYLKNNHQSRYSLLLAQGELMEKMHQVNEEAYQRLEVLMEQMLKTDPIMNPENTMESFKHRKRIKETAEEIVLHEIVYKMR